MRKTQGSFAGDTTEKQPTSVAKWEQAVQLLSYYNCFALDSGSNLT